MIFCVANLKAMTWWRGVRVVSWHRHSVSDGQNIMMLRQPNVNKSLLQKSKHQCYRIFVVPGENQITNSLNQ
jgi:hypothetical protein